MNPTQIWSAALGELQLQMTKATFDTWLRNTQALRYEDGNLIIDVESGYAKDWLEKRLIAVIKRTLNRIAGRTIGVKFIVGNQAPAEQEEDAPLLNMSSSPTPGRASEAPVPKSPPEMPKEEARAQAFEPATSSALNPRYTFESFVVGPGNRLAQAGSVAVTESPASAYNPLFIYGGVGLGKTHLLHAIGHACRARGLNILYVSSETFTNDLIDAIRSHTTDSFRDKYRTADVLMVDDIQFIAGKERTQEEFFHTFNALHSTDRQIVLSSDRPPKALSTLEKRLCSRFEWGLIADIQPPDLETRIAILRSKAAMGDVPVSDKILSVIATRVQSNIRELEGALNQVIAICRLTDQPLTIEVAEAALSNLLPQHRELTPSQIMEKVARHFGLETEALTGRSRKRDIARPRQIAMYLIREETDASLPQIGTLLGGRDHSTVIYGYERVADLMEENSDLRQDIVMLRQQLYSHN